MVARIGGVDGHGLYDGLGGQFLSGQAEAVLSVQYDGLSPSCPVSWLPSSAKAGAWLGRTRGEPRDGR